MKAEAVAVIPARWGSTRFPGKPLVDLAGSPMVVRVARRVRLATRISEVVVATDDRRIAEVVEEAGFAAVQTAGDHRTGMDRVAAVAARWPPSTLVVDVQGDEPLIDPLDVDALVEALADDDVHMATLARPEPPPATIPPDPNRVWIAVGRDGEARDFFRGDRVAPDLEPSVRLRAHVGVYGWRRDVLSTLVAFEPGPLETARSLEQFRALENGVPIRVAMCHSEHPSHGVDTPADAERVRVWLARPD